MFGLAAETFSIGTTIITILNILFSYFGCLHYQINFKSFF
jgi:hypothetical protein